MAELVLDVARVLTAHEMRLVTAESCTGGLVAASLTAVAGSSDWFEGGFVTYRPSAKTRLLGVGKVTLERYTAVSEPVARAMSIGALTRCDAGVSVAITGIAGPGGGDVIAPVGTVWFAWAVRDGAAIECVQVSEHCLDGDRESVRRQAVDIALGGILRIFE